jgi:hypothetical protein
MMAEQDYSENLESVQSRAVDDIQINALLEEPLYNEHLRPDMESGEVFLAMRGDSIAFYYKGGLLFSYKRLGGKYTFVTNRKYIPFLSAKKYISEVDLGSPFLQAGFADCEVYEGIKERVEVYGGEERVGVSYLVKQASPYFTQYQGSRKVVCIDTEIYPGIKQKDDRIDLLLFNTETRTMRFIEAKHFNNQELRSRKDGTNKVVNQINRYTRWAKESGVAILDSYATYIVKLARFGVLLPPPVELEPHCHLYLFGFDSDQLDGTIKEWLKNEDRLKGIRGYIKGGEETVNPESLWKVSKAFS